MSLVCCGFCFVSSFSQMLWKSIVLRQLQRTGNGIHTSLVIPSLVNVASLLLNTVVIIPMNTVFVWIVAYLFSFSFRQSQGGCAWPEYEEARNLKRQDDKRYPQNFKWRRGEAHTHTHTPSSTALVKQNNIPSPPVFRRTTGSRYLAVYSLGVFAWWVQCWVHVSLPVANLSMEG